MKTGKQLNTTSLVRILILVLLVVNVVILATGLMAPEEQVPPVPIPVLERQLAQLQEAAGQSNLPAQKVAEERALALHSLAEEKRVTVGTGSNKVGEETLGTAGKVQLMRSNLELRGTRESLFEFLGELDRVFGANVFISNMELRGAEASWTMKVTLTQLLAFS